MPVPSVGSVRIDESLRGTVAGRRALRAVALRFGVAGVNHVLSFAALIQRVILPCVVSG